MKSCAGEIEGAISVLRQIQDGITGGQVSDPGSLALTRNLIVGVITGLESANAYYLELERLVNEWKTAHEETAPTRVRIACAAGAILGHVDPRHCPEWPDCSHSYEAYCVPAQKKT